ncbi:unnamed protein product [Nezara viridula]|uniref:Uncharacterized protein n=1 Tax=Nezara viridula TaxID=85310 RepID=A0A9P0E2X9_NEZVI|nr:unnamed protein product [Nezara viridula]
MKEWGRERASRKQFSREFNAAEGRCTTASPPKPLSTSITPLDLDTTKNGTLHSEVPRTGSALQDWNGRRPPTESGSRGGGKPPNRRMPSAFG